MLVAYSKVKYVQCVIRASTAQYSTAQYSAVQYSRVQNSTAECSTVQYQHNITEVKKEKSVVKRREGVMLGLFSTSG